MKALCLAVVLLSTGCGSSFEPSSDPMGDAGTALSSRAVDSGGPDAGSPDGGPVNGVGSALGDSKACDSACSCAGNSNLGKWTCDALGHRCVCPGQ